MVDGKCPPFSLEWKDPIISFGIGLKQFPVQIQGTWQYLQPRNLIGSGQQACMKQSQSMHEAIRVSFTTRWIPYVTKVASWENFDIIQDLLLRFFFFSDQMLPRPSLYAIRWF